MRLILDIDDGLAKRAQEAARASNQTVEEFVAEVVERVLPAACPRPDTKSDFKVPSFPGGMATGVNVDKIGELLHEEDLENFERLREADSR